MKRLGIFVFYDKDGLVDEYVIYLIKCLNTVCDRLVVVSNGDLRKEEVDKILVCTHEILTRENKGYDVGAYKEIIINYLGFEEICKYDELVLMNDTVYGPFIPMKDIFEEMQSRECNFWGITKQAKTYMSYGKIDDNIQSYFLVFDKEIINSRVFQDYWEKVEIPMSFIGACKCFENVITKLLEDSGFIADTYVDSDCFDTRSARTNFNHYAYMIGDLVCNRKMPFLKKKPFTLYDFCLTSQMELPKAFEYVIEKTDYDVNMIWKNILRTYSIDILENTMGLTYITDGKSVERRYENSILVIYIENQRTLEWLRSALEYIRKKIKVKIICSDKKIYDSAKCFAEEEKEFCQNANRDNALFCSSLVLGEYDSVCYIFDDPIKNREFGLAVEYTYINELIDSFIMNMDECIQLLERNESLGLIKKAESWHSFYWNESRRRIHQEYNTLREFAKQQNIFGFVNWKKNISTIEGGFWARGDILEKIKRECTDYKSVMMLLPYIFQKYLKYTMTVIPRREAQSRITNLEYIRTTMRNLVVKDTYKGNYLDTERTIMFDSIMKKMAKYKRVYVYGAGGIAREQIPELIKNGIKIANIIVSVKGDEQSISGIPIVELAEIKKFGVNDCIYLALNKTNQLEVMPNLIGCIEDDRIFYL